jgi:phage terminase small subunit
MGRPRKPTRLLELEGSFQTHPERRRARAMEPKVIGDLGAPPACLDEEEKAFWWELSPTFPDGLAGKSDRFAFEDLVVLAVKARRGTALLSERRLLAVYLSKFGLTPADRNKVSISHVETDPLGEFLERRKM